MRKTVLCPYFRQEFDRVEGWCEEMERRGLRLVQVQWVSLRCSRRRAAGDALPLLRGGERVRTRI